MTDPSPVHSRVGFALWKARARLIGSGVARGVEGAGLGRRALLLSRVFPFRFPTLPATHQNESQAREFARALAEIGYEVDVADFDEHRRVLDREYDLVIDLHPDEHPIYEGRLRPGAKRICYITGSNPTFSNEAERARLADLVARRGVSLRPRRQVRPFPRSVLQPFDAMFLFGNKTTLATYAEFRLPPVRYMVNNGYDDVIPTDPSCRDPRCFLFMASVGQVHKGLDLLLEIFAREPDLSLVVCSMFARERDFVRAYRRELFETPTIRPVGFVDVRSPAFRDLQAGCGAMILPSCSEGQSGSVTVAMSFGLPCIVSAPCGFEEPEIWTLPDCSIGTIRSTVREWASRPHAWVRERSERTLALLRRGYTRADYARSIRDGLAETLGAAAVGAGAGAVR